MNWIARFRSLRSASRARPEARDVIVIDDPSVEIRAERAMARERLYGGAIEKRKPWSLSALGVAITIAVHIAFVGTLALGARGHSTARPANEGFSSVGGANNSHEPVSILFFVNDHSLAAAEEGDESDFTTKQQAELAKEAEIQMTAALEKNAAHPPSIEDVDPNAERSEETTGDGAEAAMLFGRYLGQMKARIERAWEYNPRTVKVAAQCRVQIRQSKNGDVKDISVMRCDMPLALQMSLVRAIQAASPLSAPPSEKVFSEVITLTFSASPEVIASSTNAHSTNPRHASVQLD